MHHIEVEIVCVLMIHCVLEFLVEFLVLLIKGYLK